MNFLGEFTNSQSRRLHCQRCQRDVRLKHPTSNIQYRNPIAQPIGKMVVFPNFRLLSSRQSYTTLQDCAQHRANTELAISSNGSISYCLDARFRFHCFAVSVSGDGSDIFSASKSGVNSSSKCDVVSGFCLAFCFACAFATFAACFPAAFLPFASALVSAFNCDCVFGVSAFHTLITWSVSSCCGGCVFEMYSSWASRAFKISFCTADNAELKLL